MTAPTPDLPDGGDALLDWADLAQSFGIAIAVLIALVAFVFILSRFLYICGPHEILVFYGRKHKMPDGSMVGFKVIHA